MNMNFDGVYNYLYPLTHQFQKGILEEYSIKYVLFIRLLAFYITIQLVIRYLDWVLIFFI